MKTPTVHHDGWDENHGVEPDEMQRMISASLEPLHRKIDQIARTRDTRCRWWILPLLAIVFSAGLPWAVTYWVDGNQRSQKAADLHRAIALEVSRQIEPIKRDLRNIEKAMREGQVR